MKNKVQIPLIFFLKTIFDQSGGIEPRIENVLKIGSTNQKESKEESSQAKSFSLKTALFRLVGKQVRLIERNRSKNRVRPRV